MTTKAKKHKARYIEIPTGKASNDEGVLFPEHEVKKVIWSHTKRYHNCLYLLIDLNPCSRNLMDYLTEIMDENNEIRTDQKIRNDFVEYIEKESKGQVTYGDDIIKKAFTKLKSRGLLFQKERGLMIVNPELFIKNNDQNRLSMIKMTIEFMPGKSTKVSVSRESND